MVPLDAWRGTGAARGRAAPVALPHGPGPGEMRRGPDRGHPTGRAAVCASPKRVNPTAEEGRAPEGTRP